MTPRNQRGFFIAALFLVGFNGAAIAWSERAHHLIAVVAAFLVKDPALRNFLLGRQEMLGYLADIPDVLWRDLKEQDKSGQNAHFMNPEPLGYTIDKVPLDLQKIAEEKKMNGAQIGETLGTLWWRANQFFDRSVADGQQAVKALEGWDRNANPDPPPAFNDAVLSMVTNMGLLAHFVGDGSMPLHNRADYDGKDEGHGGAHDYYERLVVDQMSLDLAPRILAEAQRLRASTPAGKGTVLERMRELSTWAAGQAKEVFKHDPIKTPSDETHRRAVRPPPAEAVKGFEDLIIGQLARSALLLADLWDEIYVKSGKPRLSVYRSFKYPVTPAYVPTEYLNGVVCSEGMKEMGK